MGTINETFEWWMTKTKDGSYPKFRQMVLRKRGVDIGDMPADGEMPARTQQQEPDPPTKDGSAPAELVNRLGSLEPLSTYGEGTIATPTGMTEEQAREIQKDRIARSRAAAGPPHVRQTRQLMATLDEEGQPISAPDPRHGGTFPVGAAQIAMPGSEITPGTTRPDIPPATKSFDEGAMGFGDPVGRLSGEEYKDVPATKPPPTLTPGGAEETVGIGDALLDMAMDTGRGFGKWLGRVITTNSGRVKGAVKGGLEDIEQTLSDVRTSAEIEYTAAIMTDLRSLRDMPQMPPEKAAQIDLLLDTYRWEQQQRRNDMAGHKYKIIHALQGFESHMEDRMENGLLPRLAAFLPNAIGDGYEVASGLTHLVFLDILGFAGETEASKAMSDVDSMESFWDYQAMLFGEGIAPGADLSTGILGVAMALAGDPVKAMETTPFTTMLFLHGPMSRGKARLEGKVAPHTRAYRLERANLVKRHGEGSPQVRAWERGEGFVPKSLRVGFEKSAALKAAMAKGMSTQTRLFWKAAKAQRFRGSAEDAMASMRANLADAVHQIDESSSLMLNRGIRGTRESEATIVGLGRFLAEETKRGDISKQPIPALDPSISPYLAGKTNVPTAPPPLRLGGPAAREALPPGRPAAGTVAPPGSKRFRPETPDAAPFAPRPRVEVVEGGPPLRARRAGQRLIEHDPRARPVGEAPARIGEADLARPTPQALEALDTPPKAKVGGADIWEKRYGGVGRVMADDVAASLGEKPPRDYAEYVGMLKRAAPKDVVDILAHELYVEHSLPVMTTNPLAAGGPKSRAVWRDTMADSEVGRIYVEAAKAMVEAVEGEGSFVEFMQAKLRSPAERAAAGKAAADAVILPKTKGVTVGEPFDPRGTGIALRDSPGALAERPPPLYDVPLPAPSRRGEPGMRQTPGTVGVTVGDPYMKPPPLTPPYAPKPKSKAEAYIRQGEGASETLYERGVAGEGHLSGVKRPADGSAWPKPEGKPPRNRRGVWEHEWDSFLLFVEETYGRDLKSYLRENPTHADRIAIDWFERKGQSRPRAAISSGLHRFTPDEAALWGSRWVEYVAGGDTVKKAEYKAYRDVLAARGMKGVTSDYRSLGLDVGLVLRDAEGAINELWAKRGGQEVLETVGPGEFALTPAGRVPPPRKSGLKEGEAFAEFDRAINDRHPLTPSSSMGEDGAGWSRHGGHPGAVQGVINLVEQQTGYKVSEVAIERDWGGRPAGATGGTQGTLGLRRSEFKFSPEAEGRISRAAESVGVSADWVRTQFAEVLETDASNYYMKSQMMQKRLRKMLAEDIRHYDKSRRVVGDKESGLNWRRLDDRAAITDLFDKLDKKAKSLAVGWDIQGVITHGTGANKFTFNVREAGKHALMKDKKWASEAMADAVMSTAFTMADNLREATVREIGRREYAKAPVTQVGVANAVLESYTSTSGGIKSVPALLRSSPEHAITTLQSRLKRESFADITPNDLNAALASLRRYQPLTKEAMEQLGFDQSGGPVWAPKKFAEALQIERMAKDMIKNHGNADRALRSVKRNLVPLNILTTLGNAMSDMNLTMRVTGRPSAMVQVVKDGYLLHKFQTGKVKHADNPRLYELMEAFEQVNLVDATLVEAEFGFGAHKGILSIMTDAMAGRGMAIEKGLVENAGMFVEKYWATPMLKAFRGTTNAFKFSRAMEMYRQGAKDARGHLPGERFGVDMFPNRTTTFEVVSGVKGFPGGRGYKEVVSGKTLTPKQWLKVMVRQAKVSSDKLFFDYGDAGRWARIIRSHPALRFTMGSLFHMYYIKSAYIPGVNKGLLFNSTDVNPSVRPTNAIVKAEYAARQAAADQRVFAMHAAAFAAHQDDSRDVFMERMGFSARQPARGVMQTTLNPVVMDYLDISNVNYLESSETVARLISSGIVWAGDRMGMFDEEGEELGYIYPSSRAAQQDKTTMAARLNHGLGSIPTREERAYIKSMRKLKMRELAGKGANITDIAEIVGLAGGPFLDMIATIKNDDAMGRVTDIRAMMLRYGYAMVGGTAGRLANVAVAMADSASPYSSFKFSLKDPELFMAKPMSGQAKHIARWAIRTVLMRTWHERSVNPESPQLKRYMAAQRGAWTATMVKPLKDRAKVYKARAGGKSGELAEKYMREHDRAMRRASEFEAVIEQTLGEAEAVWGAALQRNKDLMRKGSGGPLMSRKRNDPGPPPSSGAYKSRNVPRIKRNPPPQ